MLMNKPMKGPVKKHLKILNYLFNSLHFLIIFHMKILNVLNEMLNIMQFSLFSLLLFKIVGRKTQSTDQIFSKYAPDLKSKLPREEGTV